MSHGEIFLDILIHIFIVDNVLLLSVNRFNDGLGLIVEVGVHTLNIISLGLKLKESHILLLLLFDVDGWTIFGHATIWIITETKEVTKYVVFGILPC